jgi:type II secretory pathway component GspD/PulD (secretin)
MGRVAVLLIATALAASCSSRSAKRAEEFVRAGDWDSAVAYFTRAVQEHPDRPEYKIALERAMQNASNGHMDKAKEFEAKGELENAVLEYNKALEFAPSNTQASHRRSELERLLREKADAARPTPRIDAMRERARRQTEAPVLSPASKELISLRLGTTATLGDILKFLGETAGINIIVEQGAQSLLTRPVNVNVEGVTLEQSLNLILTANQLWYKVMNERTILVIQDTAQKRQQYEDQVIRTFYISHADPQELFTLLGQVMRIQGVAVQPVFSVNKSTNTITVRGTPSIVNIFEKVIEANDRPRAEIVIDVELLEVNRARAKELGLNLSQYQVGAIFSPEGRPGASTGDEVDPGQPGGVTGQLNTTFNLNTITQGISTADFYLTVPQAIVKFLASDTNTKLIAKPQLRGAEGTDIELNLGDEVPVPQTTYGGIAAGGINTVPIQSFVYRPVGVIVKMNPRVTFENEIVLSIEVENSTLGGNLVVAGQSLPTFGTRKVRTRMRLREGESNLLAGLVREEDRRVLRGIPGLLRVPILKDIIGNSEDQITQTDIVILLTPRIVRTHELTQQHLNPIYIGSQINLGLTGPPSTITAPPEPEPAPPQPAQPPPAQPPPPQPPSGQPAPYAPPGAAASPGQPPAPVGPGITPSSPAPQTPSTTTTPGLSPVPSADAAAQAARAAQVTVTTPGPEFMVGGGPYTVPISISGASRLSLVSLSVTFNPAVIRVRNVQEGPFLRQGNVQVSFNQQADPTAGRVDISLTRSSDTTGASGTGLLAALVVEAIAPGAATFSVSGVATTADGQPVQLAFAPASVTVK